VPRRWPCSERGGKESARKHWLADAAKLRGTDVKLAAAARSASVTTAMTLDERVGTSICDRADQIKRRTGANGSVGASAASITAMLDGMCVNTIVLIRPKCRDSRAATGNENAESTPDQKKKTPACASERLNRSKSQRASSDWTTKPS
jgi:hypothetical protein